MSTSDDMAGSLSNTPASIAALIINEMQAWLIQNVEQVQQRSEDESWGGLAALTLVWYGDQHLFFYFF